MTPREVSSVRSAYLMRYRGWTLKAYTCQLDRWLAWCAGHSLNPLSVRRTHVEQYIRHLSVEMQHRPMSVGCALTPVRGFYRIAHDEGLLDRDPAANARLPRILRGPGPLGLDRHDMQALFRAAGRRGGQHQAAMFLLGCLGLHNWEARAVCIEDFSQTVRGHRVLELVARDGVLTRMPLPVPVVRALDEAAQGRESGPLMLGPDGIGPLHTNSLRRIVRDLGKDACLPVRVVPKLLRISCIVNALDSGASLRKVSDLARHIDAGSTVRYERDRTGHDDHAVRSLVAYLEPAEPG
jgi:integrase/recombinase XerD